MLGQSGADPLWRTDAGTSDVVFGFGSPSVSYPHGISATAGTPITSLTSRVARTGTATFSVSPPLPAGLVLDPSTGVISGTPMGAGSSGTYTVTLTDLAGVATAAVPVSVWADASSGAATPSTMSQADDPGQLGQNAASASSIAVLKVRTRCGKRICITSGTVPEGARAISQSARRTTPWARKGRCVIKTRRRGATGQRARVFSCTVPAPVGRLTITTRAHSTKGGAVVAQTVVQRRVR
jgi:hypothetical protein